VERYNNIVILTGAGLSAESGLGTFRGPGGLWDNFRIEDVATPEGFARDPVLVHNFYNLRRSWHKKARPNAAHLALARLEREHGNVLTVTQNIDALHEAAGTKNLIHMHGELERALCAACGVSAPWKEDLSIETLCQACGAAAMRPDVVWFGEMPRGDARFALAAKQRRERRFELGQAAGDGWAEYRAGGDVDNGVRARPAVTESNAASRAAKGEGGAPPAG
jgi:NAD-dependent protein deacetylase/lipoamidase